MKYREMTKFLNENGIYVIQPMIASELSSQLENDIQDEEFEEICEKIYRIYLGSIDDVNIRDLVDEELTLRGYKN